MTLSGSLSKVMRTAQSAVFADPVLAYWWTAVPNFGDLMNPMLIEALSGRPAVQSGSVYNVRHRPLHSVIGSVLQLLPPEGLVVWGSGFIHQDAQFRWSGASGRSRSGPDIRAVRGPLTRDLVRRQGVECPAVYGDPALLFPRVYPRRLAPAHRLGLIPHYVDLNHPAILQLSRDPSVRLIDVRQPVREVIDAICSCDAIASTSLHGIIVALAYGVPAVWIEASDKVKGDGFKFRDFFQSIHAPVSEPVAISGATAVKDLVGAVRAYPIELDADALLDACPFRKGS